MARARQYQGQGSGEVGGTTRMTRSGPPSTSSAVPKSLNRGRRVTPAVAKPVATSAKKKKEDGGRQARVKCTEAAPPSKSSAAPTTHWNVYARCTARRRCSTTHAVHRTLAQNPRAQGVSRESGKTTPYPKRPKRGRGHPGARAAPRHRPRAWLALLSREREAPTARGRFCLVRIFGTKAEPQRIVATRPLCRVQHPVPHSSRLQGIHRVGPVTCDRVRLRPKLGVLAAERPTR